MRKTALARSTGTPAVLPWVLFGAAGLAFSTVLADEPPQLQEGLWSIHSEDVDAPSNKKTDFTSTLCRSHASDEQTRANARNRKECTTVSEQLQGNQYTVESRCTIRGSAVQSKSTTLFLGNTAHTVVHITYTPALNGVTDSTLTEDQKYIGKCPAGAEPGELMLPNGSVEHLGRAQSSAEPIL